ncbi:hypothetical protein AK812_SmicGene26361 [Symbiodinium microadriaticum]|uniref:Reverse transcriptase domain-containing protein n=1 Tax=Symbiodinium microadriaticum TaxID=2951 RepID=A0A1Q9D9R0_SYMMI|nr:hypothetical protein AK812_SmicGene26361 [Symbiodinium microadriaticum]
MPRSTASSEASESLEPSVLSTSESGSVELPLYYAMSGPPRPPVRTQAALAEIQDERLVLSEQSHRSLAWLQNIVLRFFCWQSRRLYMEETLRQPQRNISASMSSWGRTQHELPAEAVLDRAVAHLDSAAASSLQERFAWLKELLQARPARNDRAWILTVGNQHSPSKQLLQGQLWPHVVARLRQRLPDPLVQEVADTLFNMASGLWYQDYLTALCPWLPPEAQLEFQQWFQDYEWHQYLSLPPPEATTPDVDRDALPRGSADPPPRAQQRALRDGSVLYKGKEVAQASALRFASLEAGRLFHVRIMREQVAKLLPTHTIDDALQRAWLECTADTPKNFRVSRNISVSFTELIYAFPLPGGMTLSLDLSKAYDRLPSDCLLAALQNMSTPPDLIAAIMYIHDNAKLVLQRHDLMDEAPLGQGIRLNQLVPPQALTGYADDFLVNWTFQHPRDFTNACVQNVASLDSVSPTAYAVEALGGANPAPRAALVHVRLEYHKEGIEQGQEPTPLFHRSDLQLLAKRNQVNCSSPTPSAMATVPMDHPDREELLQAQAELEQFSRFMQSKSEQAPSQSSTPLTATPPPSIAPAPSHEEMEVDKDKRHANQQQGPDQPPAKWAKGEAKGDKNDSTGPPRPTGKGTSDEPLLKAAAAFAGTGTPWPYAKKETDPSSLTQPMRNMLFYCVWASLLAQLRRMEVADQGNMWPLILPAGSSACCYIAASVGDFANQPLPPGW